MSAEVERIDDAAVPPEAAERVDAAVEAMLGGRRPQGYAAAPEEVEALRGAALLAGARDEVAFPEAAFVDSLADRLRAVMTPPAEVEAPPAEPIPLHRPGRRAFLLRAGAVAAAAAAAGVIGDRVVEQLRGDGSPGPYADAELVPTGATWRDVAALATVRTAGPVRFRAGSVEGVLALTPDGAVAAFSAVCTHMGCLLDVGHGPDRLVCPCHGAAFGVDGTPMTENYIPLPRLPWLHSRVNGDRVEVLA
jgi:nitrite reductase/ring-hydroxylating ferredoxin subunit